MTTAEITADHERLTRYVHGHFKRKLTFEDAADAAAEALAEIDRASGPILQPERWLRRAAWRNALDMVRKIEGEGETPRQRPAILGDHVERLADGETTDGALLAAATHQADADALASALRSLKFDEQRALHLRYVDGLDVPTIVEILGCSRHHYENLHKRGLKKLRNALAAPATTAACREARGLILATTFGGLAHEDATRRDAHLDACLACRAFARRQRGLIAALPLPAATATGLLGRLGALFTGATVPVKVATVCTTCVVATGAGTAVERHELAKREPAPPRAATVVRAHKVPVPTTTPITTAARPSAASAATRHAAAAKAARTAASPFLPESASDPRPPAEQSSPIATTAAAKPPSAPKQSSFAQEFTP